MGKKERYERMKLGYGWLSRLVMCGALMVLTGFSQAHGQALTDRERDLLEMIKKLEERVQQLEDQQAPAKEGPDLNQRLEELETKIQDSGIRGENDFRVFWKEGLNLETDNKRFKVKIGGRIQNDWAWFDDNRELDIVFGDQEDGTEFRRARLFVEGTMYDDYSFKAQYDFAGNDADTDFKDVWLAANKVPYLGQVKIGHFKEPFSLNELTSSKYNPFMERGLPNAFAPGRNTGIQISNSAFDKRLSWALGVFRETGEYGNGMDDGGYNVTGRVSGLPWYKDGGRKLLHLGAGYSHRNVDGGWRYRARPEAHLSSVRYVDTGTFQADDVDLYNAELALVYGPLSFQTEYTKVEADTLLGGDETFDGYYAMASYFITGEHRPYKKGAGTFDKVKPKNNFGFGEGKGWGAWELALRYSTIDLDDKWVRGGEEDNFALGVNWYLNPNMRVMLNYVKSDIDHIFFDGDIDVLQSRFQIFF
jgi:phosphate-selective porin OprO/OprP